VIEEVTTHEAELLDLPIDEIVRDKPRVEALLIAFAEQIQALETVNVDLITERSIASAIGEQLDVLGRIVGEVRRGADDEPYRNRIRVRVLVNRSNGTIPELLEILRVFEGWPAPDTSSSATRFRASLRETATMQLFLQIFTLPANTLAEMRILLRRIKPAGVTLDYAFSGVETGAPLPYFAFTWSGYAPVVAPPQGFGYSGGGIDSGKLAYAEGI
jgi:hypothetical protein